MLPRLPQLQASGNPPVLAVGSLDSKRTTSLLQDVAAAVYAPPGYLVYALRGTLHARRFDARSRRFSGQPIPISTGRAREEPFGMAQATHAAEGRVSVSRNGMMLLQWPQAHDAQLTWFDRAGNAVATLGPPRRITTYEEFDLSADGRRVALKKTRSAGMPDIWLVDAANGSQSRLTTDAGQDQSPVWSPDGRFVYTNSSRAGALGIYRIAVDGSGEQLVMKGAVYPHAITSDGRSLIYLQRGLETRMDAWALPLVDGAKPSPLLASEFEERNPVVSPDGRWLAYTSDVTGSFEVYVRSLAESRVGEAVRVSQGGGICPRWRPDGRELFFIAAETDAQEGDLMAVPVETDDAAVRTGTPVRLFSVRTSLSLTGNYDVGPNGRILVDNIVGEAPAPPTLVLNWTSELQRQGGR